MSKKVKVIPIKEAMTMQKKKPAPIHYFEKQKGYIYQHSVYTLCPNCKRWGINMPGNLMCGDCNYPYGITYYSAEDVNNLIQFMKNNY